MTGLETLRGGFTKLLRSVRLERISRVLWAQEHDHSGWVNARAKWIRRQHGGRKGGCQSARLVGTGRAAPVPEVPTSGPPHKGSATPPDGPLTASKFGDTMADEVRPSVG